MKKIIAVILVLTMVAVLSVNVFAAKYTDPWDAYGPQLIDKDDVWYKEAREFVLKEGLMKRLIVNKYFNGSAYYFGGPYESFEGEAPAPRSEVALLLCRYNGSYDILKGCKESKSKFFR